MTHNWLQKDYPPDDDLPDFDNCSSVLSKVLTPEMYAKYRDILTPTAFTFDQVIQIGVDNYGTTTSNPGCVAGDEESYRVYKDFFDAIIAHLHNDYKPDARHKSNLNWTCLTNYELDVNHVHKVSLCFNRNIRGLCLLSHCTRNERRTVENILVEALSSLKGKFKGKYHQLTKLTSAEKEKLLQDGVMFNTAESELNCGAGIARDWPDGRGVWYSNDKSLVGWINNEDHLSLTSTIEGGNIKCCFMKLCQAISQVKAGMKEKEHKFMKGAHLGHICSFPSKLGGFELSVRVVLPNIAKEEEQLDHLLSIRGLQKSVPGNIKPTIKEEGIYDISNTFCLGLSESEWVQHFIDTIRSIIEVEQELNMQGSENWTDTSDSTDSVQD